MDSLMEDVIGTLQTTGENLQLIWDKNLADMTEEGAATEDEKGTASSGLEKHKDTDIAVLMGIIYSMVKQDYSMQEKIVSALSLKSSSGELESYSLMWSLRPFINDDIMHQAWKLVR
ncbi:hypothetical protein TorRG33x02_343220 [Trema orientale]|uniref:Uncharacterized protein n=1 Tax=Trema orientale TaxID=63057 RepID=A0A2P5ARQ9_TREOI|nr:hypothetical protein TorRG33x02_343220 [Trema orientale]